MRLTDLTVFILIIGLFCPLYSNQIRVISQLDAKIHRCVESRDSARFIPESFRNVCAGKGFSEGAEKAFKASHANIDFGPVDELELVSV